MKKWIRWKGLIPFVVIVTTVAVFFIFFIDTFIKWSIESTGTKVVGAKVELGSADFSFSPLGVRLKSLQVTNPDKPMENIIDIGDIRFNMNGELLLLRKLIIKEMVVDNIQLNTERKTSGAIKVEKKPKTETASSSATQGFSIPGVAKPDIDKILSRETLKTPALAKEFEANLDKSKQQWSNISKQLPDQKRLDSHEQRFNKIKNTNTKDITQIAIALKELKTLKQDINSDINQIDQTKKQVSTDFKQLNSQLKALKNSPSEEYHRLLNKYSLTETGVGNISHLVFGDKAKEITRIAIDWYKKLEPYLEHINLEDEEEAKQQRSKGINVRFHEKNPTPDFLIKTIRATVNLPQGAFKGTILDVASEQQITGKPTTLKFSGTEMANGMSLLLTGSFNRMKTIPVDTLNFKMRNYQLDNHKLVDSNDMRIVLKKARSDTIVIAGREGKQLRANGTVHVHSIAYNNTASGNDMARLFLGAINKTRDFKINGKISGTLDDYSTRISSDIDDRIKGNMKAQFKQETAKFKQELKTKLEKSVKAPIEQAEKKYNGFKQSVEKDIADKKQQLDRKIAAIHNKINDFKSRSKSKNNELKNKAKDKLKNLFK